MKKLITVSAIVFAVVLSAGFASAFTTTPNDGFLYFYPQGQTSTADVTLYYTDTPSLLADSFQLALTEATALTSPPVPDTINGLDLYSGTFILPVGATSDSSTPAPVTFNISAIQFVDVIVGGYPARHWSFKGTSGTGALVSGEVWGFLSKLPDRTSGTPYVKKMAYEINAYVTGNSNFNGSIHGKLYK